MDPPTLVHDLAPFKCLNPDNVRAFCCSSQTSRDGKKLSAVMDVRNLKISFDPANATLSCVVRSTHSAKTWYEVKCTLTHESIAAGRCACGGRCWQIRRFRFISSSLTAPAVQLWDRPL